MILVKYYRKLLRFPMNYINRRKLNNRNFTIISSNCVGGVITHELGLKFNSPTINLFFYPKDYIKFVSNLKHYIFYSELIEENFNDVSYPVGRLDDILIHFVHYKNFDDAKKKWKQRCKRINWDNLFFIMVERDGCTKTELMNFEKLSYKNKVVFTAQKYHEIKSSYHIVGTKYSNFEVIDLCLYKKLSVKRWIDDFDYVRFLNQRN